MWKSLKWRDWMPRRQKKGNREKEHAPDYGGYRFTWREMAVYTGEGLALAGLLAWLFYRSPWAVLPLSGLIPVFLGRTADRLGAARRQELAAQFRDMILAVSACLQAGYSVENAFLEAGKDVERLYGGQSLIVREAEILRRGIGNGVPLERLLADLGRRSGQTDVEDFAQVFGIAKRTGGNMNEIIRRSAAMTSERIEVGREIETSLTSRRYEQRIMNLVPFLIAAYLQATSKGFFDVLYKNPAGILIMTGCLLVYLAAVWLSERILMIQV